MSHLGRSALTERVRTADRLDARAAAEWQHLVSGRPAMRLEVLETMADTAATPLTLRYFLLEDGAQALLGAAVGQLAVTAAEHNALDTLLYGRAKRAARAAGLSTSPVMMIATPIGQEPGIVVRGTDPEHADAVRDELLDGVEEYAAAAALGIAFLRVPAADELLLAALRGRGYRETEVLPVAQLDIEWMDFDGYVRFLRKRSKSAAQTARNERNRFRRSGIIIRQVATRAIDVQALHTLARDHYQFKNRTEPREGPQFLPRALRALGDDALVFEAVRDGRRVGMIAVVRSGTVGWVTWFGIELSERNRDFIYANLCYYHLAESAPALGLKTLLYGNGALDAKRRRGCRISVTHLFYRPHRRVLRWAATPYFAAHRAWYRRKLQ